jgi:hypothetical protein
LDEKHVFKPVIQFVQNYATQNNPLAIRAAIIALGVIAEGCSEEMQKHLKELMPLVRKFFFFFLQ